MMKIGIGRSMRRIDPPRQEMRLRIPSISVQEVLEYDEIRMLTSEGHRVGVTGRVMEAV